MAARISSSSASVASCSASRNARIRTTGSRFASASRSSVVLYNRSSPDCGWERVGVGAGGLGVGQRRLALAADVGHGFGERAVALQEVGPVAAKDLEIRKRRDQLRNVAAGGLHFDGHGDRVAVVLDNDQ